MDDGGSGPDDGLDDADDLDDLADLWDTFTRRWEQEFQRFSETEDAHVRKLSEQVQQLVLKEAKAYGAAVEAAMADSDETAHHISYVTGKVVEAEQLRAVKEVQYSAEEARRAVACDALRAADDLGREAADRASQGRREAEARRREARLAREAASEARRLQRQQSADAGTGEPRRTSSASPPPRFTRVPGAGAAAPPKAPSRPVGPRSFGSFAEYDAAWSAFGAEIRKGGCISFADVPWPVGLPAVSGVSADDNLRERRQKLKAAVLRWHPDKWSPVLARVREEERAAVMEKVQEVTRKILDERKQYGG